MADKKAKPDANLDADAMLDSMRSMADQTMAALRQQYGAAKQLGDEMHENMTRNVDTATDEATRLSMAAIGKLRENADEAFEHLQKLSSAKSISEALELQTAFLRMQTERAIANAHEMQEAARDTMTKMSEPARKAMEEAMQKATGKTK